MKNKGTRYENTQGFCYGLPGFPHKHFITVSGGDEVKVRPCQVRTQRGFSGVERETVAAIVEWINEKRRPNMLRRETSHPQTMTHNALNVPLSALDYAMRRWPRGLLPSARRVPSGSTHLRKTSSARLEWINL